MGSLTYAALTCAASLVLTCACGRVSDSSSKTAPCATAACDSGTCDPLAAHELPVTLGTVLGIGRDSAGTIYLADEVPTKHLTRVFVSSGDSLFRKRVIGTGQTGNGPRDGEYNLWFVEGFDAATNRTLLIERRGDVVTQMALGPHDSSLFIFEPGAIAEVLTVLDRSAIEEMKFRNLPGPVTIEYFAEVENGNVIVVTRPTDDADFADFHFFYGIERQMVERKIIGVYRGHDTDIEFMVDGSHYVVHFSTGFIPDGGDTLRAGPASLDTGTGTPLRVTERLPAPKSLPSFVFSCL